MLKQMQLSKTEREREVCVGPGVTWVRVQDPLFLQTPRAVGPRVFAVTLSHLSELGQEETVQEERKVMTLVWKPRRRVDWWGWKPH